MESGKQVYHVTESHGPNVEITAIAIDKTGYRLASGALDGKGLLRESIWTLHCFTKFQKNVCLKRIC